MFVPIHQRKTSGVSKTSPPPNHAIPHKRGRRIQTNQQHLPYATGTIEKRPDSVIHSTDPIYNLQ